MVDAEDDRDSLLSPRYAIKSLSLQPVSWRTFHNPVFPTQLESVSLEIKCRVCLGWDDKIEVAGHPIGEIPCSLQISCCDQEWMDKAIKRQGLEFDDKGYSPKRLVIGALNYFKPTATRVGAQPQEGSITGWIAYGPATFDRVVTALSDERAFFRLGVEARFDERGGTPEFPTYKWSGEKPIDVLGGSLVVFSEDPDAEEPVEDIFAPEPVDDRAEMISRHEQLLAAIQKLNLSLWAIAAAVVANFLIRH